MIFKVHSSPNILLGKLKKRIRWTDTRGLRRSRYGRKNNMKIDFKEKARLRVEWINLAHNKVQWQVLVT
jgi:hypothetical protein